MFLAFQIALERPPISHLRPWDESRYIKGKERVGAGRTRGFPLTCASDNVFAERERWIARNLIFKGKHLLHFKFIQMLARSEKWRILVLITLRTYPMYCRNRQ